MAQNISSIQKILVQLKTSNLFSTFSHACMDTWSWSLCRVTTFSESVVMLMDGFLAVTDVLEPHRLFLPAAVPVSASPAPPSVLVAGDVLLPAEELKKKKKVYY